LGGGRGTPRTKSSKLTKNLIKREKDSTGVSNTRKVGTQTGEKSNQGNSSRQSHERGKKRALHSKGRGKKRFGGNSFGSQWWREQGKVYNEWPRQKDGCGLYIGERREGVICLEQNPNQ